MTIEGGPKIPLGGESPKPEGELSPEVEAMVMEKVQDIDTKGIAYAALRPPLQSIREVLTEGLAGARGEFDFNIVGRTADVTRPPGVPEIAVSYWSKDRPATVLFELDPSKEVDPDQDTTNCVISSGDWVSPTEGGTYARAKWQCYWDADAPSIKKVLAEFGFSFKGCIAPGEFLGIAVLGDEQHKEVIKLMQAAGVALPVYSLKNGDLLWPKQMSYEEVKKFVADREEKKKGQQET